MAPEIYIMFQVWLIELRIKYSDDIYNGCHVGIDGVGSIFIHLPVRSGPERSEAEIQDRMEIRNARQPFFYYF